MQSVFYDCHQPCFADEQRRPTEVKHLLQVKVASQWWEGWQTGQATKSGFSFSLLLVSWFPPPLHPRSPQCPPGRPGASLWLPLGLPDLSQVLFPKTSFQAWVAPLCKHHSWFTEACGCLESHATQASSKDLHVLESVISDPHGHWSRGDYARRTPGT